MRIGQPISKDVKLASKSGNIFWCQMLQFISDTQPLLSAAAGAQDRVTGLYVRVDVPRVSSKTVGEEPGGTADISQHSWPGPMLLSKDETQDQPLFIKGSDPIKRHCGPGLLPAAACRFNA